MATVEMSVHEALNRLKVYEKRIAELIPQLRLVAVSQQGRLANTSDNVRAFDEKARARLSQVQALIANYRLLKQAVVQSNAVTAVSINGKTMTVAAAIEFRRGSIGFLKTLLQVMTEQYAAVQSAATRNRGGLQQQAEQAAIAVLGADAKSEVNKNRFAELVAEYLKNNEVMVHDPVKIEENIEALRREIEGFEMGVDTILTAANVTTRISVDLSGE